MYIVVCNAFLTLMNCHLLTVINRKGSDFEKQIYKLKS